MDPSAPGALIPKTVEEDPSLSRFALSDGTLLHLEVFGDPSSPVLIVLPGGPGGDCRFHTNLKALADHYRVVLWDQRGAGLSQRVPDGTST